MNFLKELEKELRKVSLCGNVRKELFCVLHLSDAIKINERLWRSFWLKRKKEVEEEAERIADGGGDKGYFTAKLVGNLETLNNELSWIEKQLKEESEMK